MPKPTKRGDKWTVRYWQDGRKRRKSFSSKQDADLFAAEVERARQWGRQVAAEDIDVPSLRGDLPREDGEAGARSLEAAVEAYLVDCRARELNPKTIENIDGTLGRFMRWLGVDDLDQLTRDAVRDYRTHVAVKNSGAYANAEAMSIHAWWKWLNDEGWPAERAPHRLRLPRVAPKLQPYAPSWAEMDAAVRAARGIWYQQLFILGRCTGLRARMLMHLRWEHIDLDGAILTIPPNHPGSKTVSMQRGRVLPMAPVLVDELAGWGKREGWVIDRTIRRLNGHTVNPDNRGTPRGYITAIWRSATPKVNPRVLKEPTRAFRKGFINGLARSGVPGDIRRYLVGHKGVDAHDDNYTVWTLLEEQTRAAVAQVPPIDHEGPLLFIRPGDKSTTFRGTEWTAEEVEGDKVVALNHRGYQRTFSREKWLAMMA